MAEQQRDCPYDRLVKLSLLRLLTFALGASAMFSLIHLALGERPLITPVEYGSIFGVCFISLYEMIFFYRKKRSVERAARDG